MTETAIGHLLLVRAGTVVRPPRGSVLDGVSLRVVEELCGRLGIPFTVAPFTLAEAQSADEAMLTGTAFCLAGVRWLEGTTFPWPGSITSRLLWAWGEEVGLDIAGQFLAPA
ncbi:MAG: aminotransferase class IV [Gemmataceae bacterium]